MNGHFESASRKFALALAFCGAVAISPAALAQHHGGGGSHGGGFHGGGGHFDGGHFHGGVHFGFGGWGWGWPAYWGWGWPYYWDWPYYDAYSYGYPPQVYPYATAVVPAPAAPPQGQQAAQPPGSWYYCDSPKGYYPYVQHCSHQWREVPATPPAESTAPGG